MGPPVVVMGTAIVEAMHIPADVPLHPLRYFPIGHDGHTVHVALPVAESKG